MKEIFTDEKLLDLLTTKDLTKVQALHEKARKKTLEIYGNKIYIRGLIEFSNYCKEGCYYCGINFTNKNIERFRLSKEEIYEAAESGYELGFRTFVLQGGEDPKFLDEDFVEIVSELKKRHPDCAVTLSIGVRDKKAYKAMRLAGADRFLLRFESALSFDKLHPSNQSLERRLEALKDLKDLGYTTGTGFLVGAPYTSLKDHIEDIKLIRKLEPHMIGIGPFVAQKDTIFRDFDHGDVDMTLRLLSILRLEHPNALIPSTTALNTVDEEGRIKGILAGCNVLMPNLSPKRAKERYKLYDNKEKSGLEAASGLKELEKLLKSYGYEIEIGRGDYKL